MVTSHALSIATILQIKPLLYKLSIDKNEYPDKKNAIKGAYEYDINLIACIANNNDYVIQYNKQTKKWNKSWIKISSAQKHFLSMKPVPNYNFENNPLLLIKDT
jgi:hypothetical protein